MDSNSDNKRRLIPLTNWTSIHNYPPLGQLRALVFNSKTNGFERCIRRVGKRILIDEAQYFSWVDEQKFNQEGA